MKFSKETNTKVLIKTTHGDIKVELFEEQAPITTKNFIELVNNKFYNGLTFHRIIENFMIQGGCPDGTGMGGSDKNIKGEFTGNKVDNPVSHDKGVISMARSMMPNSASSQFFICHASVPHLDGQYAAFGQVYEGIETVDAIAVVETLPGDAPVEPVGIVSIELI